MEALVSRQLELQGEVEKQFTNFKKDGQERKSEVEYFKRRWNRLDETYKEFQRNHDTIVKHLDPENEYFKEKCYDITTGNYYVFKDLLHKGYQNALTLSRATGSGQQRMDLENQFEDAKGNLEDGGEEEQTKDLSATGNLDTGFKNKDQTRDFPTPKETLQYQQHMRNQGSMSKIDEILRKQQANFKAFARTIDYINVEEMSDKWEFEDALKSLETRWSAIDYLHWEIDSELDGKNLRYETSFSKYEKIFIFLKKEINKKMWSVSHREKSTPQLDIPIFSGNYNDWVCFKDLFSEAIHNNPTLSNAQRMQFLKSKVRGEAERLIQHLTISSDNYLTCWEILNHRFNNKKLIFTSHMNILFGLPNIQQPSVFQLKKIHDVTMETLHAIKNLGVDVTTWDPILVHIISNKLDTETYADYIESLKNARELPILQELLDFLEGKFTAMENSSRRKQETPTQKTNQQPSNYNIKKSNYQNYNNNRYNGNQLVAKTFHVSGFRCPLCKNEHGIYNCKNFLQMSHDKKLSTVNKLGLCVNCLFSHNGNACNSTKSCRKCLGQHNTILHESLEKSPKRSLKQTSGANTSSAPPRERMANVTRGFQDDFPDVMLPTAQIKVMGVDGEYRIMRALIDQCSELSLISEKAAQTLGIKREWCQGTIYGIGEKGNNCKGKLNITCTSIYNDYTFNAKVVIMNNLVKKTPNSATFTRPSWSVIQNINLADPEFYISRPVDLLLGGEIYKKIIMQGLIRSDDETEPMAQNTRIGWLISGDKDNTRSFNCNVVINNIEDIQQFWEVEDITEDSDLSSEEIYCVNYFQETTTRTSEGIYVVRLPMKPNFENKLGATKQKALAQFLKLELKMEKDEHLATTYKTFINEYRYLKHMRPAEEASTETTECYLPYHTVTRAESTTTQNRVVFNAASKSSSGSSLNDLMYAGPNLQQDLQTLLLKWRQYQFAFTADIEKMYRQIWMNEKDQHLQKIIWRESPTQPIQSFMLTTISFGEKAAPFLAMMTLRRLAKDERDNFPEASKVVEESFYMDDLVHGAHTIQQGKKLVDDLSNLLQSGGFHLRKWSSNKPEILENLTNNNNADNVYKFKTENTSKTLGLCWNSEQDKFTFKYEPPKQTPKVTKRILLSEISRVFDPLGWLAPVVTKLKLLFQKVWKTNTQWDEKVSDDIISEWNKLRADICKINEIEIHRWLQCKEHDVIELYGFCDASMEAYACVIYARVKKQQNIVIVAAKTKLVPLKKILTLPKLELSGAHLLSKLMHKVKQALNQFEVETYGWTDSQIVLSWLQGEPTRWKPFVANRVQKVTEIMPSTDWRYVNTSENPADAASRGIYASQLKEHSLWFEGPTWLRTFDSEKVKQQTFSTEEEKKSSWSANVAQNIKEENIIDKLLEKYSSITKTIRILAWIQRALTPKHKRQTSYLKLQELRKAKHAIITHVQSSEFGTEIEHLRKHGKVQSNSKLLNLNPIIDQESLLRVGGRLEQARICPEMKHPKIIPSASRLATLLIEQAHKLTFHGGPRLTLANLRQEYWITGGNSTVKKQLRKCVTCRKQEGRKEHQITSQLPAARVNPEKAFYHTGVDYTGFVDIKANKGRGMKTLKGYIIIFICMVSKALYLDVASDLTSSAFLAALRRMSARRGAQRHIYSDNGTNFVGANRVLQEEQQHLQQIFNDSFLAEITEMNIEWHFNAPAWPSAGGLWERAVRSVKHHLKRVVGQQKLTFEEYSTILAQLEACLNSRPLCALSEDIEDIDFLTPAHFINGRPGTTIIETAEDARTRWHLTQKIFQDIWKKWKMEYLTQLNIRKKWLTSKQNIETGDLVVIHEDNLPPGKWAMGRVIDVHPGNDGYVRVVTLKTKNGIMKRPVVKLSVLPLEKQTNKQSLSETVQNKQQQETKKEPRMKKRSNFITMAIMFIYILNMITTELCFQMTPLSEKQGLYFDKIANMQLIRDECKIIAYYNMNPYWEGVAAYEKSYLHLQNICEIIKHVTHCDIIMLQLSNAYREIEHNNKVLLRQPIRARLRQKRGLVNGIGYLANSLFGVLDDRFAEQYEKDIALVRENEKHLALLWKNQTTVVEAEYNLLKRTEESMQKQHKIVNQHLLKLDKVTKTMIKQVNEIEFVSEFTLSSMAANNILTHLKSVQDTLLDMTTNVYNGRLNIHLIDPEQLQTQLNIISGQLTKELTLPIDNIQTDMQNIYHLLKIKVKMTREYYIFEIRIPLISRDNFDLYNILPVPHPTGKSMASIIPIESHVAINLHKDSYLPIIQTDLNNCILRDTTTYLCQLKTPIYKMKSDKDLCVKDENQINQCKTSIAACQNKWISLKKPNQYLYFCCDNCHLRSLCNDQVTAQLLTRTNIINLAEGCSVKTENFTIYTHKSQESNMEISYKLEAPEIAPINNVINITIEDLPVDNNSNIAKEQLFKEIDEKIRTMKQNEPLIDNISSHDIHHYSSIYSLWGVVVIVAIIFVCWRARRRGQPPAETSSAAAVAVAEARSHVSPAPAPAPAARNIDQCCDSVKVQCSGSAKRERLYKDKSTTPVLRKIAFSEDSS